jgi:hypothetical protein
MKDFRFEGIVSVCTNDYNDRRLSIGKYDVCEELYEEGGIYNIAINGEIVAKGYLSAHAGYCYSSWTHASDSLEVKQGKDYTDIIDILEKYDGENIILEFIGVSE